MKTYLIKIALAIMVLTTLTIKGKAELHVYNYPNTIVNTNNGKNIKSTQYKVTVKQGSATKTCYVMYKQNQNTQGNLSNNFNDHWTNFSYDGSVQVTVEKINGSIKSCIVHPKKKGIQASISGGKATFTVTENLAPLQLYVEVDGKPKDALLIFCDPLETNVPNRNAANVEVIKTTDNISTVRSKLNGSKQTVVFEEGIHVWGGGTGKGYEGYKMPLKSNKKIYIPGGAYVIGSFSGNNISKTKIYGRGVISHSGKSRLASSSSIPFSAVYVTGNGGGHVLEGIHICDMSHFAITYRVQANINNIKIMNFWHQSDGVISGDDSKILNCFFKVMDDGVKLYSQRMYVENATHFPQVNGAPYQFCWGKQNGDNCTVKNTYIVTCSYRNSLGSTSNTAVINGRHGPGGNVETNNHTFDGIYIDNGCHRLIGFEGAGVYKNWVIKNVEINTQDRKPQQGRSYLLKGKYQNWKIINLTINGHKITGTKSGGDDPKNGKIWFEGNVGSLSFSHTTTVDNKAPSVPGIISFSNINKTSVKVSWGASTDNVGVTGYDVFMNNSLKTTVTGTSATITGLDCKTSYSFKVRAKDAAGNKSAFNNPKSASTSDCDVIDVIAPTVPGSISFSNITKTSIKISWGASTDNVGVTGYDVFMNNSLKTTVTGTSATISGLNCKTTYSLKVRAKDAAGNKSAFNNPKSATTSDCDNIDIIAPTVPGANSFSNITKTSLTISWGASTDNVGVTGYDVFMNNSYKTTVSGTSAPITGLVCNTSYNFKVRAFDAAGNQSAFNTSKSASTSACSNGQPVTVSLSPIHDAFLQGNKGYNINLLRVEPKKRTSYMMFDLSSVDGTITSAKLKLKCTSDAGSGNIKINLGKTNNWTEKNLTGKNKPAAGVQLATLNKAYKVGSVYTWNLNAASLNSGGKISFIVTQVSGNDAAFGSKENGANKPVLEITYTTNRPKVATDEPMFSTDIYPNPSDGLFNVSLNNDNTALIKIINLAGEVVYQSEIQNGLNSIDALSLNQGIYLVHISTCTKAIIKRIVIQ